MAEGHHYGPGPWVDGIRADRTSVYYHRADARGIGFDRTPTGSNAIEQYFDPLRRQWSKPKRCPEELLLWFHHVAWSEPMRSGMSLWDELCHRYQRGVDTVRAMQTTWAELAPLVDAARFEHIRSLLAIQELEARWWRDACILYFQTFSLRPLPPGVEPPEKTLEEYRAIRHYYVPGHPDPFVPKRPERTDPSSNQ
jgi:alpha-glucuronidase